MKQKDLLFILISATFVVIMEIIFSILHNSLSSTLSNSVIQTIVPINNSFDLKTLGDIKKRISVEPQTGIIVTPTPTPTPTPPPITPISPLESLSVQNASGGGTTQ